MAMNGPGFHVCLIGRGTLPPSLAPGRSFSQVLTLPKRRRPHPCERAVSVPFHGAAANAPLRRPRAPP
ncbi:protein of unknown function [Thauera humireducens]|nr:protein of unknown function [Thauera humireducens]